MKVKVKIGVKDTANLAPLVKDPAREAVPLPPGDLG